MQKKSKRSHLRLVENGMENTLPQTPTLPSSKGFVAKTASMAKTAGQKTREIMFFSPWQQRSKIRN